MVSAFDGSFRRLNFTIKLCYIVIIVISVTKFVRHFNTFMLLLCIQCQYYHLTKSPKIGYMLYMLGRYVNIFDETLFSRLDALAELVVDVWITKCFMTSKHRRSYPAPTLWFSPTNLWSEWLQMLCWIRQEIELGGASLIGYDLLHVPWNIKGHLLCLCLHDCFPLHVKGGC